jgi:hypothetical protein
VLIDCPADSSAAETYTADEFKMAESLPAEADVCVVVLGGNNSCSILKILPSAT